MVTEADPCEAADEGVGGQEHPRCGFLSDGSRGGDTREDGSSEGLLPRDGHGARWRPGEVARGGIGFWRGRAAAAPPRGPRDGGSRWPSGGGGSRARADLVGEFLHRRLGEFLRRRPLVAAARMPPRSSVAPIWRPRC
jgi:hypothetical protein